MITYKVCNTKFYLLFLLFLTKRVYLLLFNPYFFMSQKILVIRLSSIGDIVLTSPVVRCLKQQLPHAQLHFLCKPAFAGIVAPNPYIDKVQVWQNNLLATAQLLKKEHYTHIIDLHHNQRTLLLRWLLGAPATAYNKLNLQKWLAVNLKYFALPKVHIVDRYMETVHFLGVKNDGLGLDFFILPDDAVNITQRFPMIGSQPYVAFAIGAAHATKRLPAHKIITICELLNRQVILLGGKEDAHTGSQIAHKLPHKVINACGQLRLGQSASVIEQAQKVITPDTGLMHIAAAFNKPIMSLWGNTLPEFGMYPYLPARGGNAFEVAEVKNLPCRPCSKIGYAHCPQKHFRCMELIDENKVADWVNG